MREMWKDGNKRGERQEGAVKEEQKGGNNERKSHGEQEKDCKDEKTNFTPKLIM